MGMRKNLLGKLVNSLGPFYTLKAAWDSDRSLRWQIAARCCCCCCISKSPSWGGEKKVVMNSLQPALATYLSNRL
jgi:hypothetical protein